MRTPQTRDGSNTITNDFHRPFRINELMRSYCDEAAQYGSLTEPTAARLQNVLIILNPTANRRGAQKAVSELP